MKRTILSLLGLVLSFALVFSQNPPQGGGFGQNPPQGGGFGQNPPQGAGFGQMPLGVRPGGQNPPQGGNPFEGMSQEEMQQMFRRMNTPPSDPSFEMKEIYVVSAGNKLYGEAFIPVGGGRHPAIIMSHGYNSSHSGFYQMIENFAKKGFVCYCYDFAGGSSRSQSEGSTLDMSPFTEKQNLIDVIDVVRGWDCVDPKNIFILGESQGGCVSGLAAPYVADKINAAILVYPAFCFGDDGKALYPTLEDVPDEVDFMGMKIGKNYYRQVYDPSYDIYEDIAQYKGPVLIVHGTNDSLVKPEYSAKAVNVYENSELHLIFGAGHGFMMPEQRQLYWDYVQAFIDRNLK